MKNESLLGSRISRYASLAVGGLGAAAHGDIQVYNTPIPIPEGVGAQVSLSNAGLDFYVSISNFAFTSSVQDGRAKTCCRPHLKARIATATEWWVRSTI